MLIYIGRRKSNHLKCICNQHWVTQRRQDGSENFNRNWKDYEFVFGSPASEVWLDRRFLCTHTSFIKRNVQLESSVESFSSF